MSHKKTAPTEARAGQMHLLTRNIHGVVEDIVRLPCEPLGHHPIGKQPTARALTPLERASGPPRRNVTGKCMQLNKTPADSAVTWCL
jgi:hypothetical protein